MGDLFAPWHIVILLIPFLVLLVFGIGVALVVRSSRNAPGGIRDEIMSVVPRPAKIIAATLLCIAAAVGAIAGVCILFQHGHVHVPFAGGFFLLGGTFVGCLFAIWVLSLGYVYGDARRRGMPPVLWTLVAFLVPNLLGFLLYFVLRKPLASPCRRCGQPITPEQPFCSWCGNPQYAGPGAATMAQPNPPDVSPGDASRG